MMMRRFKGYHRFCEVNDGEGFWVYVRVVLMALSEAGFVDFFQWSWRCFGVVSGFRRESKVVKESVLLGI